MTEAVTTCPECGTKYAGMATCPTCVPPGEVDRHAPLAWLVPTITAATALAFAVAHVPGRVRLLGLFLVALGVGIGVLSGSLARLYCRRWPVTVMTVTGLTAGAALFASVLESHRLWAEVIRAEREAVAGGLGGEPNELRDQADRALDDATSLGAYLVRRVGQLGRWPVAGAATFLAVEILLGAIAAAWVARTLSVAE